MRKYLQLLKTYGPKSFTRKLWIFGKRKLGLDRLGLKTYAYDDFRFLDKQGLERLDWERVGFLSTENLDKSADFFNGLEGEARKDILGKYEDLKRGYAPFFSHKVVEVPVLDFNYDPVDQVKWPPGKFRSSYFQFDSRRGDIKRVFELNRLQFLDALIPAWYLQEREGRSEIRSYLEEVLETWLVQNPHEKSVAWSCSQEISIRCIKILLLLRHIGVNAGLEKKLLNLLALSALHVMKEIAYARAQRNNHAITEAAFLMLFGKLTGDTSLGQSAFKKAAKTLKQVLPDQFFADGTYIQNSITYQRFALQSLLLVYPLAPKDLQEDLEGVFTKSLQFLGHCLFGEKGEFPNYGPNDGAMLYNFGLNDYRDLRPVLNQLNLALREKPLFEEKRLLADPALLSVPQVGKTAPVPLGLNQGDFEVGGYYFRKRGDLKVMFVCSDYRGRFPGHCDSLHLEIWYKNQPVFTDSGTYEYFGCSGVEKFHELMFTPAHNTLRVNGKEQLDKGPRFVWLSSITAEILEKAPDVLKGRSYAYRGRLPGNPVMERQVELGEKEVVVTDRLSSDASGELHLEQFWNYNDKDIAPDEGHRLNFGAHNLQVEVESENLEGIEVQEGYKSLYYAEMLPRARAVIKAKGQGSTGIKTSFRFS